MGLRDRLRRLVQPPVAPVGVFPVPRARPSSVPRAVSALPAGARVVDVSQPVDVPAIVAAREPIVVIGGAFASGMAERLCALGATDVAWMDA